jgi:nicotinamide-nucleotide amidase
MKACILSIGDELVLGQTLDTNSMWVAQQLTAAGCDVVEHRTVSDDQGSTEDAIRDVASNKLCPELLVITGGLGPTDDDLTRQALAACLNQPLELREDWVEAIRDLFRRRGREMNQKNVIQAMIPRGATMLRNDHGTAAGIRATLSKDGRSVEVFALPGPPSEMKPMFLRDVLPFVKERAGGAVLLQKSLHTFGLGESVLAEMLGDLMSRGRNPSVGTTASNSYVTLRINARYDDAAVAEREVRQTIELCRQRVGDVIFGADEESLADAVAKLLIESRRTVTAAESCTGGLLAKMLTDVAGSSVYFKQGFVTYSNEAKRARLGVSENTINVFGAVSEQTVLEMARHSRRLAGADYSLAISGIAGPGGGSEAKPVGTVCIALAHLPTAPTGKRNADREDEVTAYARTFRFGGDRAGIRDRAAKTALAMLRFRLLDRPLPF